MTSKNLTLLKDIFKHFPHSKLKILSDDKAVALCPFEDHEEGTPSFYVKINEGKWHCFGCERGGKSLEYLESLLLDGFEATTHKTPVSIPKDIKDYQYLISRGISAMTQINCDVSTTNDRVYFPVYSKSSGKLQYYSSRATNNDCKQKYITQGVISANYNPLGTNPKTLYITEGAIDTLSIIEQGFDSIAVIAAFLKRKPIGAKVIRLAYDGDAAGENKTINSIIHLITEGKINYGNIEVVIIPDGEDINALHMKGLSIDTLNVMNGIDYLCHINNCSGDEDIDLLNKKTLLNKLFQNKVSPKSLQAIEVFALRNQYLYVKPPLSMLELLEKKEEYDAMPLNTYDYIFSPLIGEDIKGGRVISCCASSGVGKTTLILNLMAKNVFNSKYTQLFVSLDMSEIRVLKIFVKMANEIHNIDYEKAIKSGELKSNLTIVSDDRCPHEARDFYTWMENHIKENPTTRVIYLDHLEQLPTKGSGTPNHVVQADFMRDMSKLTRRYDVDVFLLVQVTKEAMSSGNKKTHVPSYKGAASIYSLADVYFQMSKHNRLGYDRPMDNVLDMEVLKFRDGRVSYSPTHIHITNNGILKELSQIDLNDIPYSIIDN